MLVPCQRKFVDAVKLNPQDLAATRIVKLMNDLFAIDAEAREKNMDHAARHGLRLEKAPALLDTIRGQVLEAQKNALPQNATGKAANYTLALWSKLTRFLDTQSWSYPTTSRRTLCAPLRLAKELDTHRQPSG